MMKKFSKLNESINKKILDWSPNDILDYLNKIPDCKVSYKSTQFVFRDDGHEICTLEEISRGSIKTSWSEMALESDNEYHFQYTFILDFGNLIGSGNYLLFEHEKELSMEEFIPISKLTKIFADIENNLTTLRNDFYIHLYNESNLDLKSLSFEIDFTYKDSVEKEYLI
jgi:hypothetical protein